MYVIILYINIKEVAYMSWICEKCKYENSKDFSTKCEICGQTRDLKQINNNSKSTSNYGNVYLNVPRNYPSQVKIDNTASSPKNNSNTTIILLVVIVILFVVIIGLVAINLFNNRNENRYSMAEVSTIAESTVDTTMTTTIEETSEETTITTTEEVTTEATTTTVTTVTTIAPVQEAVIAIETNEKPKEKFKCYTLDCTWEEARKDAEKKGGHLATFTSEEEFQEILSVAQQSELKYIWIGGRTELTDSGIFVRWCTNEDVTALVNSSYWFYDSKNDIQEPSGTDRNTGTVEPYLMLWYVHDKWGLVDNSDEAKTTYNGKNDIGYICEFD